MRKLFHIGVEGSIWTSIHSLHKDAQTVIRWEGELSEKFNIQQGVRQGGLISTDLYKVYINPLLDSLSSSLIGGKIGEINCVAPTCADDVTLLSDSPTTLQALINIADDYSRLERYQLHPAKSVVMPIKSSKKKVCAPDNCTWTIYGDTMPVVEETTHMGILRSSNSEEATVKDNMNKARRTIYSLMAAGLHGENGLDPETSIHLYQTYVTPVLTYGLEVVLPRQKYIDMLEKMNKKFLKTNTVITNECSRCRGIYHLWYYSV